MSRTFSSLSIRNYRIYFIGLFIANLGGWMSTTAKSWLVLDRLTGQDASALGILTGLMFAPAILFMPVSAAIADRFPKRTIMLTSQAYAGASALLMAVLVITGHINLPTVYLLAFLDGTFSALAQPAQQAFVSELVPRSQLANAISLNSASFNGARLIGPGVAGALIGILDLGPVFAINVLAFIIYVGTLLMLRTSEMDLTPLQRGKGQLRQGLAYVKTRPDILLLIAIAFMMGNFGFNFSISNAVMAKTAFGKEAAEFGLLGSIMGIGALAAALWSARRARPRLRHVLTALAGFAGLSAIAAVSPTYELFAILQAPIGLAAITVMVTANALVQLHVAAEFRGRVMALWGALLVGGTPIVSPLVGLLGKHLGPRSTVWFEALSILLTVICATLYILRSDHIRIRLDRSRSAPWLRLDRGEITEDAALR